MSIKEIKDIAPTLYNNPQKNAGFRVPMQYFETFESSVMGINKKNKQTGFKVPEAYFESVASKIFANILENKKRPIKRSLLWLPAAAAVFLLLFGIGYTQFFMDSKPIASLEIENYMTSGAVELNSYELASLYQDEVKELSLTDFIEVSDIESYLETDIEKMYYNE